MHPVAFVAGATGFVGHALVQALCAKGITTVAHVRPDSSKLADWQGRFAAMGAQVDTSTWQLPAMTEALRRQGVTHVFCCIGTTRKRKSQASRPEAETYEAVDFGLTRLLVDAAQEAGNVQRFVYLSSAGTSQGAKGAYLQARWKAEQAVRAGKVPFTIARPSMILGDREEERPLERAGGKLADRALQLIGALGGRHLRDRYRSTDDKTLAAALLRYGLDAAAAGSVVESEHLR